MAARTALRLTQNEGSYYYSSLWSGLKGKTIRNSTVILKGFGDIHPFNNGPKFLANTLFVHNCDKNFVYYWVNKSVFPNMKKLYLMSHPCEPEVLNQRIDRIYLANSYLRYKNRWAPRCNNVTMMEYEKMETEMNSYKSEVIINESVDNSHDQTGMLI
ncbi:Hypothetical protein HVR_LOCUS1056 [uncultured virus]|nr:Hypothetical protein HVR_LOCUS1056 [uncultured virus]